MKALANTVKKFRAIKREEFLEFSSGYSFSTDTGRLIKAKHFMSKECRTYNHIAESLRLALMLKHCYNFVLGAEMRTFVASFPLRYTLHKWPFILRGVLVRF